MSDLTPQEVAQFRLLKKMAIVLLIMFRLDRPIGPNEIAEILEIDRHTAGKYLKSAVDLGIITRPHYHEGYTLTANGRQLILGVDISVDNPEDTGTIQPQLAGFPPVPPTTTALSLLNDSNKHKLIRQGKLKAVVVAPDWRENPQFKANVRALKAAGIGEPARSKLANLDHVTPEYIKAHIKRIKDEGKGLGLAVHRMRSGDPMPEHKRDCGCEECRMKYVGGEFSEFIKH
jgi:hypothetical protein